MTRSMQAPAQSDVISLSVALANGCVEPTALGGAESAELFALIAERIEAIPPTVVDLETMVQLRNRLGSARSYLKGGERGAARHEVVQLHRKLKKLMA